MRHPSSPLGDEANDREAEELSKRVGLDGEVAPNFSPADAGLKARARKKDAPTGVGAAALQTESPAGEIASDTSKSPEQSHQVTENKAPALEEVRR